MTGFSFSTFFSLVSDEERLWVIFLKEDKEMLLIQLWFNEEVIALLMTLLFDSFSTEWGFVFLSSFFEFSFLLNDLFSLFIFFDILLFDDVTLLFLEAFLLLFVLFFIFVFVVWIFWNLILEIPKCPFVRCGDVTLF